METAAASLLDAESFSVGSTRDALGRVLTAISPDGSEVHYLYDEGGALQEVTLNHRGSETEQTVVGDITYDAKGRREEVVYGPTGSPTSTTTYTYDPLSQRLIRLRTVSESDSEAIQSLHYHYDPVGNITDIRDTAQQTVYFDNTVVSAANSYTYDSLYRLIEGTGREHSSEGTAQRTHVDMTSTAQPMASDPSAMRLYTQSYVYDEVGNILQMVHAPSSGTGWTRYYQYAEDGNRLVANSTTGDDPEGPYSHEYDHDAHGNMISMPHLSSMIWNHDDEIQEVAVGSETVYFQYAGGNRTRKFVEKSGTTTEERIYLGAFEIFRKRISGDIDVERESLHISDGTGRILLIETLTIDEGDAVGSPVGMWRYQLSNHIGSASTEINEDGDIISHEEYHPYGTSAYRAVDSSIEVSARRYRYSGMERDDETGLGYHTARYYASWLGRWTASDPIGLAGGGNRYEFGKGNPVTLQDLSGRSPLNIDDANRAVEQAQTEYRNAPGEATQNNVVIAQVARDRLQFEQAKDRHNAAVAIGKAAATASVGAAAGAAFGAGTVGSGVPRAERRNPPDVTRRERITAYLEAAEAVSGIEGLAEFGLVVAHRESGWNPGALNRGGAYAAREGFEYQREGLFAENPWRDDEGRWSLGTGGWFGFAPATALGGEELKNLDPLSIFDPAQSTAEFAAYVHRVVGKLPREHRNWGAVRRSMAGSGPMNDHDETRQRTRDVRARFEHDIGQVHGAISPADRVSIDAYPGDAAVLEAMKAWSPLRVRWADSPTEQPQPDDVTEPSMPISAQEQRCLR